METLVDDGLVKQIGVSNFSLKMVEDIMSWCRIKPVCNQVELHPWHSQRKLVGTLFRKVITLFPNYHFICPIYSSALF